MKDALLFGPFRLDTVGRQLWKGTELIPLPPKTFDLLEYLARRPGQLQTREHLFESLWPDTIVDDHALSVQIREIRKALGDNAQNPTYIETRHRRGYCFRAGLTQGGNDALPETHYVTSGGVNIAYQVVGSGPIDLVFVMGWVSHLEYFWSEPRFARFLRRLASFSRVILFDKRGTGLSDAVPVHELPTIEQRMEDLHAVMLAAGSSRAVICGISEGGCMSAVFAATHPERTLGLVMIGSYARRLRSPDYPWGPTREQREEFFKEIQQNWGGPVGLAERAPSLVDDPEFRRWWATYLRMGASPGAALALTRMNTDVDIRHVLPAVRVPTLVIHRAGDVCFKVEEGRYVADLIPGARFLEVPGVDHLPFVGDQESTLQAIEAFVDELKVDVEHDRSLATVLAARFSLERAEDSAAIAFNDAVVQHMNRFRATAFDRTTTRLLAAFDGPARAVRATCAVLQDAARLGLNARAGLHTGECLVRSGASLQGIAVTVSQRIVDRADNSEILVSGTLRDLVAGAGLEFEPRGRIEAGELGEWQMLRLKAGCQ